MQVQEREQWLNEQPVPVLKLHAEVNGINTSGCIDKSDLVQRIMSFERGHASAASAPPEARRPTPPRAVPEVDLDADERLARQLQAEENSGARLGSQPNRRPGGGAEGLAELFAAMAGGGGRASPGVRGAGRGGQEGSGIEGLLGALASGGGRQPERPRNEGGIEALLGALASGGRQQGQRGQQGTDEAARLEALVQFLALMAQANDGNRNGANPANMEGLMELLSQLAPNQGIDQDEVENRTATMTFRGVAGGEAAESAASDEERKCMVCLEQFSDGDELRILPCLHRYHKSCVEPWLAQNRHCPVCKHDVTQEGGSSS